MPMLVKLTPLFVLLLMVGWGAFALHKGITIAGGLFFYLIGKATYIVLRLHHLSYKRVVSLGASLALVGFIMACVDMGPIFVRDELLTGYHPVTLVGAILIILGIATVGYVSTKREQELATKN